MRSRLLILAFFCVALLLQADSVFACSCAPNPPVLDAYEAASAVVMARVLSVETDKVDQDKDKKAPDEQFSRQFGPARLIVEKVYKGNLRVDDELFIGGRPDAACTWSFHEQSAGHQFLLYLRSIKNGWFTSTCSRSRGVEWAGEDLLYLDNMAKLRGKTRVSGTYSGWLNSQLDEVANRTIRIVGEKKTYETKTDANGVFEIYDLPPGNYSLRPEIPEGWQMARYARPNPHAEANFVAPTGIPLTLGAGKHVTVPLVFEPSNAVEGTIVDADGNPMKDVCAHLWKPNEDTVSNSFACTDKDGHFHIQSVPAGSYLLGLNSSGKVRPDEPFPRLFYPGVTQREKAALIDVGNGETVKGIDLVLPKFAEIITVSGVVLFSNDKLAGGELVNFKGIAQDGIDGDVTELTDDYGLFTLKLLKGVKGEFYAEFGASIGEYDKCQTLDDLIKATGEKSARIKSSTIKVDAERSIDNLVLKFPFPKCKPKEQ